MKPIDFNDIINLFDLNEYHIGYLNKNDITFLNDAPVKTSGLTRYSNVDNALVFVKHTTDYDYSMYHFIQDKIKTLHLDFCVWSETNLKNAAVLASLGQYGKNQMFHDSQFGFDNHIVCIIIFNEIYNLPKKEKPNWNFLPQCEGCLDCYNACPVKAIHNLEPPYYVEMMKCDNFCTWGNDEKIPSMKWLWGEKIINPPIPKNILKELQSPEDALEALGFQMTLPMKINGKEYWYQLPTCRECASQPKCSKYNGKYPYDPNNYKIY
jgi:ferredoxin